MSLTNLWREFHQFFSLCLDSNVEECETIYLTDRFLKLLWRIKDDVAAINKISSNMNGVIEQFYMIDSHKAILLLQVIAINQIFELNLFQRIFDNFIELFHENEEYVKYIIYKNRLDSSALWIAQQGPKIFPLIQERLDKCRTIRDKLQNPRRYKNFSDEEAKEHSMSFYNFFGVVSRFAEGIEGYVDRLFEGSKRGELAEEYINSSYMGANSQELKEQIDYVNKLYKYRLYDVIPFKIRLILEFLVKKILESKTIKAEDLTFFKALKRFEKNFSHKKTFPTQFDIDRLHELRKWGNFTAHDVFPAISKKELVDKKKVITRLIKNLIRLNPSFFKN